MSEWLQTYDAEGRPLGMHLRSVVHSEGLWHRAAIVLLFRADGRLLLQRRSLQQDVCPGRWDLSVAEHLLRGESYLQAARRGLSEELTIDVVPLRRLGRELALRFEDPDHNVKDYERQLCFACVTNKTVHPNAVEVSDIGYFWPDELVENIRATSETLTPWFRNLGNAVDLWHVAEKVRTNWS